VTDAETALEAVFPPGHVTRKRWVAVMTGERIARDYGTTHLKQGLGTVQSALALLESGRLRGLIDGVRAETMAELLDQAEILLKKEYLIAAAVLAGGALETHLLHLCQRNELPWVGDGSISKYDQPIAQARKVGTVEVYSGTDSKLVTGWGGIRNDAAHEPTKFKHSAADVRLMLEGIRQFIARVP